MYWIFVQIFNSPWLLAIDVCIRSRVDIDLGTGSKADIITLWNNISVMVIPWFTSLILP
jgi:hypothetical protein